MRTGPRARARPGGGLVSAVVVERVMRTLAKQIDGLELPAIEKISEAHAEDPFRILIGTLLSARTQDATTHAASTRLFRAAPTPRRLAALPVKRIERLIYPVGFYRNKARFVKATSQALVDRYGGTVPRTMEDLVTLPGVGRKTANLVMIIAFRSEENICVDTHVHRISNRMGWVRTHEPEETERALYAAIEQRWWRYLNQYLVTWGQHVCRPVHPRCRSCAISVHCRRVGVSGQQDRAS
jgi:endonuclease-3